MLYAGNALQLKVLHDATEKSFRLANQQETKSTMKISLFNCSDTCFNFTRYSPPPLLRIHKKEMNQNFLQWFIGFSEGDGCFAVHKKRFFFIINQQEEQILHHIRANLGFGVISPYANHSRYSVTSAADIDRLISLFNGNLVLEKTKKRFSRWLTAKNVAAKCSVPYSVAGNGWLSGFIDGEGCFSVSPYTFRKDGQMKSIVQRFILDQKGERDTLECIRQFLGTGNINQRRGVADMWRYTAINKKGLDKLGNYLRQYPLRTWKRQAAVYFFALRRLQNERKERPWVGKKEERIKKLLLKISTRKKKLKEKRLIIEENLIESSETVRETTLDFQPNDISFLQWFIGFSQGSASWVRKKKRFIFKIDKGKQGEQLLLYIRDSLGFGTVVHYGNYWRYVVTRGEDVKKLIAIFSGNLLLSRSQQRFTLWCNNSTPSMDCQCHPLFQSSRLAGYIDARGKLEWEGDHLVRFDIDQREGSEMLHEIGDFLQGGSIKQTVHKFRFSIRRHPSLGRLLRYFCLHPLQNKEKSTYQIVES